MKTLFSKTLILISLLLSTPSVFAMGEQAKIFESAVNAGIWDHETQFFLRMDLAELADLKNQSFVWAGFYFDGKEFKGEIVANQYEQNERRFPARASLLKSSSEGRYFLIEVLNDKNEVIKEFFLKGPASKLPTR